MRDFLVNALKQGREERTVDLRQLAKWAGPAVVAHPVEDQRVDMDVQTRAEWYPAYSSDGKHIAYFTARNGAEKEAIWVMEADGSNAVQLVGDEQINVVPRWMGDSETLIHRSMRDGVETPGEPMDLRSVKLSRAAPQILPVRGITHDVPRDGRLVYIVPDGSVQVFNLATQQITKLEAVKRSAGAHGWHGGSRLRSKSGSPTF